MSLARLVGYLRKIDAFSRHREGRVCLVILGLARNLLRALMHMGAGVTLKAG
jgi:hypothetical protein